MSVLLGNGILRRQSLCNNSKAMVQQGVAVDFPTVRQKIIVTEILKDLKRIRKWDWELLRIYELVWKQLETLPSKAQHFYGFQSKKKTVWFDVCLHY